MKLDAVINNLEQKAAENIKAVQGDYYGDDGLLYCGQCNTPKQCRITVFGKERTPYCLCKCEAEKQRKEDEQRKIADMEDEFYYQRGIGRTDDELLDWLDRRSYKKSQKLQKERHNILQRKCFPDSNMSEWTFENDDGENPEITRAMKNYVGNFDKFHEAGKGLLLYGGVGTGKTYAAACIANPLIDIGYPVLMTNFESIAKVKFEEQQEFFARLNRYPLLILDDLAAERKTEYMNGIVYSVIDARYRAGLPLIVTTNLTAEELKNPSDMSNIRTYSRLLEMCHPIKVEGKDKRREKLKANFASMSELLGL